MESVVLLDHNENATLRCIPVNSCKFSLGRGVDNSHVVDDLSVSRRHSVLKLQNNEWYISDMSANGTWLNGSLINKHGQCKLTDGDIIKLSDSCMYTFKVNMELSRQMLSEEEIVTAAEEVIASVEAFNSEFPMDCNVDAVSLLPEIIPVPSSVIQEPTATSEPSVSNNSVSIPGTSQVDTASTNVLRHSIDFVEEELQCSICTEMFVKAVTLACSHTFCSYCITQWQKTKQECPICRTRITTKCSTIILDNYIQKVTESANDEFKKHRQEVIVQRETFVPQPGPSTSSDKATMSLTVSIDISSEDDNSDYDSDDEGMSDCSDWDDDDSNYGRGSRPYYGGYGRCYRCNKQGHWANGCPLKK